MIVAGNGEITHIKLTELKYISKEYRYLYGIENLPVASDDLIIMINQPYKHTKMCPLFSDEKIQMVDDSAYYSIAITLFGKKSLDSVVKTSLELPKMVTIYNGKSVEIELTNDNHVLAIVDQIRIKLPMHKAFGQLLVFGQSGLKYCITPDVNDNFEIENIKNGYIFGKVNWDTFTEEPINLVKVLESFKDDDFTNQALIALDKTLKTQQNQIITNNEIGMEFSGYGKNQVELNIRLQEDIELEIERLFYHSKALNLEKQKNKRNPHGFTSVISQSSSMGYIKSLLEKVSPTKANVLLTGESGTGKTLIAKEIHLRSNRSHQPFVMLNCAAIPESLIESELFGYEEGSFTGAKRSGKQGYFELANQGTLFLDEIGELPISSQSRLLEVLQNNSFYRIGGSKKVTVDVRIIAATNLNLEERVDLKLFRKDLYYRLSVFPINIPPLRERIDDVSMLSRRILPKICDRLELEPMILSQEAVKKLTEYHWPGNVRELENVLERAIIISEGRVILPEHLQFNNESVEDYSTLLKHQVERFEKRVINDILILSEFNKTVAAQKLGIGRTTLFEKMKRYGIEEGSNAE